jgi:hypothetical protein
MRVYCYILFFMVLTTVNSFFYMAHAQLGFDLKIDKPDPYEERQLRSEKTSDKKLKGPSKFFQNLTTHYNYFFNANNKLNEVITGAKESFKEDYAVLLPFYNYSLDVTSQNSKELDSVIYKAQTGIVMHDLRNDWADNMYLLWGAAWFFEKKFDSASLMFQFINYAFAEKEKDGYYKYIGSRMDGNNALTVSTKEKDKSLKPAPSRNTAFIWQIRSMIEQGNFAQAGSLIATLKKDPIFPKRLKNDLEEVQAYWFYKQNVWDSSATHLLEALDQAHTKQERARWEYLAAQMFELSRKNEEAKELYAKAIKHTTDPVLEIHSRLNLVRINKEGGANYIDKNIEELLKMAKKDKYSDYRDVIYYMAAQMEMERNNYAAAEQLFIKASKYNRDNIAFKSKAYLQAADLSYIQKKYAQASRLYDSIQPADLTQEEMLRVDERKPALKKIIANLEIIARQDSLQRIAAMSEDDRTEYISKLLKQINKSQGGNDNSLTAGNSLVNNNPGSTDIFSNPTKGEWYFYNQSLKTQGQQKFKQSWGSRPNVDNWRRFSDVSQQGKVVTGPQLPEFKTGNDAKNLSDNGPSFNSLLANVPLTAEAMTASNDSIRYALFALGSIYQTELGDHPSAITTFESIRVRFPYGGNLDEVLFNLYYAYKKSGDEMKAAEIKAVLLKQYPNSRYAIILSTGKDPLASASGKNPEITNAYEAIYDMFLEGRFDEAIAAKSQADSTYKTNYWQPQLLYIQAVYHVKHREDSLAGNLLQTLINQNPGTPLASKSQTMIDVLKRRNQIEAELASLEVARPKEDTTAVQKPAINSLSPVPVKGDTVVYRPMPKKDSVISQPKSVVSQPKVVPKIGGDTVAAKNPVVQTKQSSIYYFDPGAKHSAMVILEKVDVMFVNETKNAFSRYNKEKYYNQTFETSIVPLDEDRKLLIISGFTNAADAISYVKEAKKIAHLEIVPWLKSDKYSFSIMSDSNLPILLEKKDLPQYSKFLDQNLPGKF